MKIKLIIKFTLLNKSKIIIRIVFTLLIFANSKLMSNPPLDPYMQGPSRNFDRLY